MENMKVLERQYYNEKSQMDWKKMAAIIRLMYPESDITPQPIQKAKIDSS